MGFEEGRTLEDKDGFDKDWMEVVVGALVMIVADIPLAVVLVVSGYYMPLVIWYVNLAWLVMFFVAVFAVAWLAGSCANIVKTGGWKRASLSSTGWLAIPNFFVIIFEIVLVMVVFASMAL